MRSLLIAICSAIAGAALHCGLTAVAASAGLVQLKGGFIVPSEDKTFDYLVIAALGALAGLVVANLLLAVSTAFSPLFASRSGAALTVLAVASANAALWAGLEYANQRQIAPGATLDEAAVESVVTEGGIEFVFGLLLGLTVIVLIRWLSPGAHGALE